MIRLAHRPGAVRSRPSYDLRPQADPLLTHIAGAIEPLPNAVHVEGYTDSLPCSCSFGNYGLSFYRAQTVLEFMDTRGFTSAIATTPSRSPTATATRSRRTARHAGNPRNRRVEIVILRNCFTTTAAGPLGNPVGGGAVSAASTP